MKKFYWEKIFLTKLLQKINFCGKQVHCGVFNKHCLLTYFIHTGEKVGIIHTGDKTDIIHTGD